MRLSFQSWFNSRPKTIRRPSDRTIRLGVESLEERTLMTAGLGNSALLMEAQQTNQAGQIQVVNQLADISVAGAQADGTIAGNLLAATADADQFNSSSTAEAQTRLTEFSAGLIQSRQELQAALDAHTQQSTALQRLDTEIQQASQTLTSAEKSLADKTAAIADKEAAVLEANKSTLAYQQQLSRKSELTVQVAQAKTAYDKAVKARSVNRNAKLNASLDQQVKKTKTSLDALNKQLTAQNIAVQNADKAMKRDAVKLKDAMTALGQARMQLADAVALRDQAAQALAELQANREQVVAAQGRAEAQIAEILGQIKQLDLNKPVVAESGDGQAVDSTIDAGNGSTTLHTLMAQTDADGFTSEYPQGIKVLANTWNRATEMHEQNDATSFLAPPKDAQDKPTMPFNPDTYLRDMLDNEWNGKKVVWDIDGVKYDTGQTVHALAKDDMMAKLVSDIAKQDLKAYDLDAYLDDKGDYRFKDLGNNRMEIRYLLTGNWASFKVEVPTEVRVAAAAAAGALAAEVCMPWIPAAAAAFVVAYDRVMNIDDPKFTAHFDIEMTVRLWINPELDAGSANNLVVSKADVKLINARIDKDNFFADVTKAVDSVMRFAGDEGIFAPALEAMEKGNPGAFGPDQLRAAFTGLNSSLQQAAAAGLTQLATRVDDDGKLGKLVLELTQPIPQTSLHLTAKDIGSTMSGTEQQKSLVKTYVAISMDGRQLKSMEAFLFDPAIAPWIRDASVEEVNRLVRTGTNFGTDFEGKGQHTIRVEIWRSVRLEDGVAIPPGVTTGLVAGWDLVYDFKTQKITGAFGTAGAGQDIVLTSTGAAPATVTIVIGEDAQGKWNPKSEEAPVPPNQEVVIIPDLNPEPGWDLDLGDDFLPWYERDWNMEQVFQPQYQIRDQVFMELAEVQDIDNAAIFSIGDDVSLNPQPLPPRYGDAAIYDAAINDAAIYNVANYEAASDHGSMASVGDAVSLNPQPLPPKIFSQVLSSYAIQ